MSEEIEDNAAVYRIGDVEVIPERNELMKADGVVSLEPIAMDILVHLICKAPNTVSNADLLDRFWPNSVVEESTIHRKISQIRLALGDNARQPSFIATVPKRGYRVIALIDALKVEDVPNRVTSNKLRTTARSWWMAAGGILLAGASLFVHYLIDLPKDPLSPLSAKQMTALHTVAVLPLVNFDGVDDGTQIYSRLHEEILERLSKTSNLQLVSNSSSVQAAESPGGISGFANKLNVGYLVEGSLRRRDNNLRISVSLSRTEDELQVWAKTYNQPYTEGIAPEQNLAGNIAHIIASEVEFDIHKRYELDGHPVHEGVDPQAVEAYFKAVNQDRLYTLGEGGSLRLSERFFRKAVEIQPNFVAAHLQLANLYIYRVGGQLRYEETYLKAHEQISKAQAIKPTDVDLIFQRGQMHLSLDWDYAKAQVDFQIALSDQPDCGWCYLFLANIAMREGRLADARPLMEAVSNSRAGDEHAMMLHFYALLLTYSRNYERALYTSLDGLNLVADGPARSLLLRTKALAHIQMGEAPSAKPLVSEAWNIEPKRNLEAFIYLFAKTGDLARAKRILDTASYELTNHGWLALGHFALGDIDAAFMSIEAGIKDHNNLLADTLRTSSLFDGLRNDPRFADMLGLLRSQETFTTDSEKNGVPPQLEAQR